MVGKRGETRANRVKRGGGRSKKVGEGRGKGREGKRRVWREGGGRGEAGGLLGQCRWGWGWGWGVGRRVGHGWL